MLLYKIRWLVNTTMTVDTDDSLSVYQNQNEARAFRFFSVRRSLQQKIFVTKRLILWKPFSLPCRKDLFQGGANSGFSRGGQNDFCSGDKSGEISILPTPGTTQSLAKTLMGKCQISKSRGGLCPPFPTPTYVCKCTYICVFIDTRLAMLHNCRFATSEFGKI